MEAKAYLLMTSEPRSAWAFPVTEQSCIIGRDPGCQLPVGFPTVSRRHCEVWAEDDKIYVRDLDSVNGTFVNGSRIRKQRLDPGDLLQVGPLILQLVRAVGEGEQVFQTGLAAESTPIPGNSRKTLEITNLLPLEKEIVRLLAEGYTEKEVARLLKMTMNALHSHVKQVHNRLGVSSRAQLIALYWRNHAE